MKQSTVLPLIAAIVFAASGLFAQGIRVSGGLGLAFMLDDDITDDMSDGGAGISTTYGLDVFGDYLLNDQVSVLLGLGYYTGSNEESGAELTLSSLIITMGGRYCMDMDALKITGMAGFQYISTTAELSSSGFSSDSDDTAFGFLFGGGVAYDLGDGLSVGAEMRILVGATYSDDEIPDDVAYDNVTLFFFASKTF